MMVKKMKGKYDKYWGNVNGINPMLFIAVVLDPRHKLEYVIWVIGKSYNKDDAQKLTSKVKETLFCLFKEYNLKYASSSKSIKPCSQPTASADFDVGPSRLMREMLKKQKVDQSGSENRSELDKYFGEECEPEINKKFDILAWWKINSSRFPILSLITRDVLAMPVSTVTSESTFTTGGCILDPFRSSLTPNNVEALICGEDWIRFSHEPLKLEENLDDILKLEMDVSKLENEGPVTTLDD